MTARWPRDDWLDAIWDEEDLGPTERAAAYAYARYAGSTDESWCTWDELMRRTGAKRTAVYTAVTQLRDKGWLLQIAPPRHHEAPVYRLTIPVDTALKLSTEEAVRGSQSERLNGSRGSRHADQGFAKRPSGVRNPNPSSQKSLQEKSDHPRARAATTAAAVDGLLSRTGITITEQHAEAVVAQLLDGRVGIRDPARYVRRAIERDDNPQRFLPTPIPPPGHHRRSS